MAIEILMPALSPTMTEGNLIKWHKAEGDIVSAGEVIAEIETDKATMEVEAVDEGKLGKIAVAEGTQSVKVNQLIAVLLEDGEDVGAAEEIIAAISGAAPAAVAPEVIPTPPSAAAQSSQGMAAVVQPASQLNTAPQLTLASSPALSEPQQRVFASPLAKRIAKEKGIEIASIQGSGPNGRVIKADVENFQGTELAAAPQTAPGLRTEGEPAFTDIPLNNMRKVIAQRLTESKQQVPHFYLTIDCCLDTLMVARKEINASLEEGKISVNDFIVKAVAMALHKVPAANTAWLGEALRQYHSSDVCVAVAIDGGLITPIVRDAEHKSLSQISAEVKSLAARAKAGELKPEEFQGGTFTVSNLGMYGIREFSAILNPPQACILAVGKGEKRAVISDKGEVTAATMMTCTLSVDHRAVDGAVGSEFLAVFKEFIESPVLMLV